MATSKIDNALSVERDGELHDEDLSSWVSGRTGFAKNPDFSTPLCARRDSAKKAE